MIDRLEFSSDGVVYGITKANTQNTHMKTSDGFSIVSADGSAQATVEEQRHQLAAELGFRQLCTQKQVHGIGLQWVDEQHPSDHISDALITSTPGILLCASVADCCGVLLWNMASSVVAAVHSGWRGTQQGVVPVVVREIDSRGVSSPDKLCAWLSPCASGRRYVVRRDVQQFFPQYCREIDDDQYLFDNTSAIRDQLLNSGLKMENINISGICTIEDTSYHSYRRDGAAAGRMAAFIGLRSSV